MDVLGMKKVKNVGVALLGVLRRRQGWGCWQTVKYLKNLAVQKNREIIPVTIIRTRKGIAERVKYLCLQISVKFYENGKKKKMCCGKETAKGAFSEVSALQGTGEPAVGSCSDPDIPVPAGPGSALAPRCHSIQSFAPCCPSTRCSAVAPSLVPWVLNVNSLCFSVLPSMQSLLHSLPCP